MAICHPLHARIFVHANATAAAICINFILWMLLEIPECYTYSYTTQHCPRETYYFIDTGIFLRIHSMNVAFKYLWFVTGFVVPLCILTFCNIHLVQALRASMRMRQEHRVHGGRQQPGRSITPTLVAIILMFLFLVTPGEITHFVLKFINLESPQHNALILAIMNLMNTLNFSINFLLYCLVNVHFRSTLIDLICCCCPNRKKHKRRFTASAYSAVTTKTEFTVTVAENEM